jgi:oligopeptidase B
MKIICDFDFKKYTSFYGNIILNKFVEDPFERFFIDYTDSGIQECRDFINKDCNIKYAHVKRYFVNKVPLIVAKPLCEIKGLMVVCYGGYGLPTNLSTRRWKPYLEDGWIIAFACVRGSGDVNKLWADEARIYKKENAVEDLENCIYFLQNKFNISYKNTCIYGRSAGGYLIGATLVKNPEGKLFSMMYAEVPYVDILRTTTNASLPLTILEYDEFGNPAQNIYEFKKILELSPVDALEYNNPPNVYVLIRTSENDSEVYTYESYKWLEALRGKNKNDSRKILYNSQNEGHFVKNNMNYSEDFFLLKQFRDVKKE